MATVNGIELGARRVEERMNGGRRQFRCAVAARATEQDKLLGRAVRGVYWRPVTAWGDSELDAKLTAEQYGPEDQAAVARLMAHLKAGQ